MLYLIVAVETRDTQINIGDNNWCDWDGQVVLGSLYAEGYEDALRRGSKKYDIEEDYIDAYALID